MPSPGENNFARRQQLGAAGHDELDKLPPLEFKRLHDSGQPVGRFDDPVAPGQPPLPPSTIQAKSIKQVRHYENFTAVISDDDTLHFFDSRAHAEPVREDLFSKEINVDWVSKKSYLREILQNDRIDYIGGILSNHAQVANVKLLPLPLRLAALQQLSGGGKSNPDQATFKIDGVRETDCSLDSFTDVIESRDGRNIILKGSKGGPVFIARYNPSGVLEPPRNWRRFDAANFEGMPEELLEFGEEVMSTQENIREFTGDIVAEVSDGGLVFRKKGSPATEFLFKENVPAVKNNICTDKNNPNLVFYCSSNRPDAIFKIDISGDSKTWNAVEAQLPTQYEQVEGLQFDPTGNFFVFTSGTDVVVLRRDTLAEVGRRKDLRYPRFGSDGNLRGIDKDGKLVVEEVNLIDVAKGVESAKAARIAASVSIADAFAPETAQAARPQEEIDRMKPYEKQRDDWSAEARKGLSGVTNLHQVTGVRQKLEVVRQRLLISGLQTEQANFVISGAQAEVDARSKELSGQRAGELVAQIEARIASGVTFAALVELQARASELSSLSAGLDDAGRSASRVVLDTLDRVTAEMYRQHADTIATEVQDLLKGVETQVKGFETKSEFDDWVEFTLPSLNRRLVSLLTDCPPEAQAAYKAITQAKAGIADIEARYKKQFAEQYSQVRERAAAKTEAIAAMIGTDIGSFLDRLRQKGFKKRDDAEKYVADSDAETEIRTGITDFARHQPEKAKELERALNVGVANICAEIERGGFVTVAETGQQMVAFGKVQFPQWEAPVAKQEKQTVEIRFAANMDGARPDVAADQIRGDVQLVMKMPDGSSKTVRLYEDLVSEDELRLGLGSYRGKDIKPSYLTGAEFKSFKKDYTEWFKNKSKLRAEREKLRQVMSDLYKQRKEARIALGSKTAPVSAERLDDAAWQVEYKAALEKYAEFCAEHRVVLLERIEAVESGLSEVHTNGKGYVPEWQGHWVTDVDTDKSLAQMAEALKMQLELHEGVLNLYGHAGTGKDVLVKMFCARTKRTYFSTDCTKWTTEFELAEDVMLEARDGATQTVKVPSAVLQGIQTPGAVVYFNELNGMPEQAQIFLHALFDEKRSLTLKTSSGKVIRANPSVLFVSSMNPDYPGTFDVQFATKSRMVDMEVNYPPLLREPAAGDANPNKPYNSSEALRIAREVSSLEDMTYEPIAERNDFIKAWDHTVNLIENGAPALNSTKQFDMRAILALVQFANKLREEFMKGFEDDDTGAALNALPVTQPITSRELRRCAKALSNIPAAEKATADYESVARDLLEKFFLAHIYSPSKREKVRAAMKTWTSPIRVAR